MIHNISHINSFDNTNLFVQSWRPQSEAKAVIVLVHGIGEHSSRYYDWASRFTNIGYAVIAFDQRGHGLSSGKRGVISSYDGFMKDIDLILVEAASIFSDIPAFLYGHSMGGGEVLNHLLRKNSNYIGVISTSPWIITQAAPPKFVIPLVRVLSKFLPKVCIETKFDTTMLSHDKEVARRYNEDDLVHHKVSFRLFESAYDAGYQVLNSKQKIKKPLLLLHGDEDEITNYKASQYFAAKNEENCTFKLWTEGYHELHNENFKEEVFDFICDWMNDILNKK